MIDSIAPQLNKDDYLTIIWDSEVKPVNINTKATIIQIKNSEPLGFWGHGSRNKWQNILPGDFIINGDDDDVFFYDAMDTIRKHCISNSLYIFRMQFGENVFIPTDHKIAYGNIGTPCGVYMGGNLPTWAHEYGGDYVFYKELAKNKEVVYVDKLIYKVKP
jgi:hypothetical protein